MNAVTNASPIIDQAMIQYVSPGYMGSIVPNFIIVSRSNSASLLDASPHYTFLKINLRV